MATALVALLLPFYSAQASEHQDIPTVAFLGDSLTAGYGIDPEAAYPALLRERARSSGTPIKIINAGISGDTSSGGLRRLAWMLREEIQVLVIALGANDGLRGLDPKLTEKNLTEMITKARAKYPEVRILLTGMLAPPNMGEDYFESYKSVFPRVAETTNVSLMPFLLKDVAARAHLNLPDGIHPNEEGQAIMAKNMWEYLEPLIVETHSKMASGEKADD